MARTQFDERPIHSIVMGTPDAERSTPPDVEELLNLASDLARDAAEVHAEGRRMVVRVEEKGSPFNLVTEIDRRAERAVVDGILATRPDDGILGEEGTSREGTSGVRWVIDPLDGTANFVYGYPAYTVSIGIEIGGEPVAGVVFDTGRGVLFRGARGATATADGEPIAASRNTDVSTAMLATGFSFDPAVRERQGAIVARLLPRVRDVRRSGAASVDLCALACGAVDAYFEAGLAPWDVAAGMVIAEAAGATVLTGTVAGQPGIALIGANPRLLAALASLLRDAGFELTAG